MSHALLCLDQQILDIPSFSYAASVLVSFMPNILFNTFNLVGARGIFVATKAVGENQLKPDLSGRIGQTGIYTLGYMLDGEKKSVSILIFTKCRDGLVFTSRLTGANSYSHSDFIHNCYAEIVWWVHIFLMSHF